MSSKFSLKTEAIGMPPEDALTLEDTQLSEGTGAAEVSAGFELIDGSNDIEQEYSEDVNNTPAADARALSRSTSGSGSTRGSHSITAAIIGNDSDLSHDLKQSLEQAGFRALKFNSASDVNALLEMGNCQIVLIAINTQQDTSVEKDCALEILNHHPLARILVVCDRENDQLDNEFFAIGCADVFEINKHKKLTHSLHREAKNFSNAIVATKAQQQTNESTLASESLLSSTNEAIAYVSDGMVLKANQALAALVGEDDEEELCWQPFIDLVSSECVAAVKELLKNCDSQDTALRLKTTTGTLDCHAHCSATVYDSTECIQFIFRPINASDKNREETKTERASESTPYVEASSEREQTCSTNVFSTLDEINCSLAAGSAYCIYLPLIEGNGIQGLTQSTAIHTAFDNALKNTTKDIYQLTSQLWVHITGTTEVSHIEKLVSHTANTVKSDLALNTDLAYKIGGCEFDAKYIDLPTALGHAYKSVCRIQHQDCQLMISDELRSQLSDSDRLRNQIHQNQFEIRFQALMPLKNQAVFWFDSKPLTANEENLAGSNSTELLSDAVGESEWGSIVTQHTVKQFISVYSSAVKVEARLMLAPCWHDLNTDEGRTIFIESLREADGLCVGVTLSSYQLRQLNESGIKFIAELKQNNFAVIIEVKTSDDVAAAARLSPDLIKLSAHNDDPEVFNALQSQSEDNTFGFAIEGVNTAQDLAKVWQSGFDFAQGTYLHSASKEIDFDFNTF